MGIVNKLRSFSLPAHWHVRTDEEGNEFYWNITTASLEVIRVGSGRWTPSRETFGGPGYTGM